MNKQGQVSMGSLLIVFITVIVGLALLVSSAQNVGQVTNTINVVNESLGVASNSTTVYLTNYKLISGVVIYNNTGVIVPATNYTVTNNVVHNGALAVSVLPKATTAYQYQWNISGTAEPTTYDSNSGGRALAGLIIIFAGLAIAVVVLVPTLKSAEIFR